MSKKNYAFPWGIYIGDLIPKEDKKLFDFVKINFSSRQKVKLKKLEFEI